MDHLPPPTDGLAHSVGLVLFDGACPAGQHERLAPCVHQPLPPASLDVAILRWAQRVAGTRRNDRERETIDSGGFSVLGGRSVFRKHISASCHLRKRAMEASMTARLVPCVQVPAQAQCGVGKRHRANNRPLPRLRLRLA